jgi:uncharacterized protein
MLLVRTRITQSPIHGLGVFAEEPITAGTAVWQFCPGWDIEKELNELSALPPHARELLDHFGYIDRYLNRMILCFDNARFINHSDNPNVGTDYKRCPYGLDVALRDVAAGEELTSNYETFELPEYNGIPRVDAQNKNGGKAPPLLNGSSNRQGL